MVRSIQLLLLVFRIVIYDNPKWTQYTHHTRRPFIQIFAGAVFEKCYVHYTIPLGHADTITKIPY